jgi:hypothetical protein
MRSQCGTGYLKEAIMTAIEYLDRPPTSWFVLDVMRKKRASAIGSH